MVEAEKPGKTAQGTSFLRLLKAVFWSFFGVRRRSDLESDAKLNPLHLVAAGLIGAALFIVILLVVVRSVVG
jgi:Protein of unknown function (DUF2970)